MDLSTAYNVFISATATKAADLADSDPSGVLTLRANATLADGSSTSQANQAWGDTNTLAGAADADIDLAGSLSDIYGDTITFTAIKMIMVVNQSGSTTYNGTATDAEIQVGGGDSGDGTNAWDTWITSTAADGSEAIKIPVGGTLCLIAPGAGYAVTAGTGDILRIKNNDATDQAAYQIILIGVV